MDNKLKAAAKEVVAARLEYLFQYCLEQAQEKPKSDRRFIGRGLNTIPSEYGIHNQFEVILHKCLVCIKLYFKDV